VSVYSFSNSRAELERIVNVSLFLNDPVDYNLLFTSHILFSESSSMLDVSQRPNDLNARFLQDGKR
jgi:hypothetical protein